MSPVLTKRLLPLAIEFPTFFVFHRHLFWDNTLNLICFPFLWKLRHMNTKMNYVNKVYFITCSTSALFSGWSWREETLVQSGNAASSRAPPKRRTQHPLRRLKHNAIELLVVPGHVQVTSSARIFSIHVLHFTLSPRSNVLDFAVVKCTFFESS